MDSSSVKWEASVKLETANAGNCSLCGASGKVCSKVVDFGVIAKRSGLCATSFYCDACCSAISRSERLQETLISSRAELEAIVAGLHTLLQIRNDSTQNDKHSRRGYGLSGKERTDATNSSQEPFVNLEKEGPHGSEHSNNLESNGEIIIECHSVPLVSNKKGIPTEGAKELGDSVACHPRRREPSECYFCKKVLTSKENLKLHLRVHTNERLTIPCPECKLLFITRPGLKHHRITMHGNLKEKQKFKNALSLRRQALELKRPRGCYFCGRQLKTYKELMNHIKIIHTKEVFPEQCRKCGKTFPQKKELKQHEKLVCFPDLDYIKSRRELWKLEVERRRAAVDCYFCKKHIKTKQTLETHMFCHTTEEPRDCIKCPSCQTIYSLKGSLTVHLRQACNGTRSIRNCATKDSNKSRRTNVQCYFCGKIITSKSFVGRHLRSHTKEDETLNCKTCRAIFYEAKDLKTHNLTPCQKLVDKEMKRHVRKKVNT